MCNTEKPYLMILDGEKRGINGVFGKNVIIIEPKIVTEDVFIQVSDSAEITKELKVTVPMQYDAYALVEQQLLFRINPCVKKEIVKLCDKEYRGKQINIVFVSKRTIAQSAWGFGNIQVNNVRLKEAYRVGANGKFSVEIIDQVKLIQSFPNYSEITIDTIREKTISSLKTIGTSILGEYFSNTETSVFEMSSLIADFRDKFMDGLQNERIFSEIGVKIATLTVDGFHANEEDLEIIRNRINERGD